MLLYRLRMTWPDRLCHAAAQHMHSEESLTEEVTSFLRTQTHWQDVSNCLLLPQRLV